MVSIGLLRGTDSPNPMAESYKEKTAQIDAGHEAERKRMQEDIDRKDREMLTVFELAGDGRIDEAKMYAQSKGVNPPPQIYENAAFAKGLAISGQMYPGDPAAAQKFTMGWMSSSGDFQTRLMAGQQAAGNPVNPDDRMLQRQIALEEWKLKHRGEDALTPYQSAMIDIQNRRLSLDEQSAKTGNIKDNFMTVDGVAYQIMPTGELVPKTQKEPDQGEYEAYQKAYNSAISSGLMTQEEANQAGQQAADMYKQFKPQQVPQNVSSGTQGGQRISTGLLDPMAASNAAIQQRQSEIGSNPMQTPDRALVQSIPVPPGLPPGTVYIDTLNGYPVYQDPQGNRYVNDGTP